MNKRTSFFNLSFDFLDSGDFSSSQLVAKLAFKYFALGMHSIILMLLLYFGELLPKFSLDAAKNLHRVPGMKLCVPGMGLNCHVNDCHWLELWCNIDILHVVNLNVISRGPTIIFMLFIEIMTNEFFDLLYFSLYFDMISMTYVIYGLFVIDLKRHMKYIRN